jgi:hypothetical protein
MHTALLHLHCTCMRFASEYAILEVAKKEIREKLRTKGIHNVTIRANGFNGDSASFTFSGEAEAIKKAKESLGFKD